MVRPGLWLILLFLLASGLNAWVLWLQMQYQSRMPDNYLYGVGILIELVMVVFTMLAFGEIVRGHHRVRSDASERIKAARLEGAQSGMQDTNT